MRNLYITLLALLFSFSIPKAFGTTVGAILGNPVICNTTTLLSDTTAGGTWISSNTAIATVASSGIVTGVANGTSTISYTVGGATVTQVVTVSPVTVPLGATGVCVSNFTTLSDPFTMGGIWSSSNTGVATVGSGTGEVTGVAAGTSAISYTVSDGCSAYSIFTVNAAPSVILGELAVCGGFTSNLFDSLAGGTWTSSNTSVGSIGSTGIVTAITPGTTTISYTTSMGCSSSVVITVNGIPTASPGSLAVCVGGTDTLICAPGGGAWSSSNISIANIGLPGHINGVTAGTTYITYALSTGCYADFVITVDATVAGISGPASVCVGSTFLLTDATLGGTWSSSNTNVTIGSASGIEYANAAGTAIITYTLSTGCVTITVVTVNPGPTPILGLTGICTGGSTTLSDLATGGTWSSGATVVVVISTTGGLATGVMTGTSVITYTLATGCTATTIVTVNPGATSISGPSGMCIGLPVTFTDATGGGVWSSSNLAVGTIGSVSGVAVGLVTGTTTISYTVGSGCSVSIAVTVFAAPDPITGVPDVCVGSTTSLSDVVTGGTWSSSSSITAIAGSAGIVTGILAGTATISYTVSSGCGSSVVVTVNPLPSAISGASGICVGGTDTLSDSGGGTWSSSNTSVATIGSSSGILSGISAGNTIITYTASTGCVATFLVTVVASVAAITGTDIVCIGFTTALNDATVGGTWSSSSSSTGSISATGIVTGISAGATTISYTLGSGCSSSVVVTVTSVPSISGSPSICLGGSETLSSIVGGGSWTSSNIAIVTIAGTGVLSGISIGTTTITYAVSSGCIATLGVTVIDTIPIIGSNSICVAGAATLSDATIGGTWTSSTTSIATVGLSSGVVSGIAAGTANITYIIGTGCLSSATITVNALPTITATATENCGGTYSLTGSGAGTGGSYLWSPSAGLSCATCASSVATVSSTVSYVLTGTGISSCSNMDTVTVNGNRISGYITMTVTPTDTLKVWLIQFNATDSTLTAEDSTFTCLDGGAPYYEFDGDTAGNYMVKAKLLSSVAGTSGYVPTYGLSTIHWDTAAAITHGSATDTQHINMIYGIVPSGPGFIGGLIDAGAGRGTSGPIPVVGMLVYLEDASGNILTYTYTGSTGAYSFSSLAYGAYIIYPVDYHYHTTPWDVTLSASDDSIATANFYEHTMYGTITPESTLISGQVVTTATFNVYPNPAINELNISWQNEKTGNADVIITDITGREVYKSVLNISFATGSAQLDIHNMDNGIYFIAIKSGSISYTNKLLIQE